VIREGVILAAGVGSRLGEIARGAKFAVNVAGRPLIHYPILSLASVGVKKIVVVTRGQLIPLLQRVLRGLGDVVSYEICVNNEWRRENGFSLLVSEKCLDGDSFLLSMSDHIYPSDLPVKVLLEYSKHSDSVAVVGGDRRPLYVDVEEATRIRAREGEVVKVGKRLSPWSHVDTGVFVMRREIFEAARLLALDKEAFGISDVINLAIRMGYRVRVADVTGIPWTEVDTVDDYLDVTGGRRRDVVFAAIESWQLVLKTVDNRVKEYGVGEKY